MGIYDNISGMIGSQPIGRGNEYGYDPYASAYRPSENQGLVGFLGGQYGGPLGGMFGGVVDQMLNNRSDNRYLQNSFGSQIYGLHQQNNLGLIQAQIQKALESRYGRDHPEFSYYSQALSFGIDSPQFQQIAKLAGVDNELGGAFAQLAANKIGWIQKGIGAMTISDEASGNMARQIMSLQGEGGMRSSMQAGSMAISAATRGLDPGTLTKGFGKEMESLSQMTGKNMEELFSSLDRITGDLSGRMVDSMKGLSEKIRTVMASTQVSFDQLMTSAASIRTQLEKAGVRDPYAGTTLAAEYEYTRQAVNQGASKYGILTGMPTSMEAGNSMLEIVSKQGTGMLGRARAGLMSISGRTVDEFNNSKDAAGLLKSSFTNLTDAQLRFIEGKSTEQEAALVEGGDFRLFDSMYAQKGSDLLTQTNIARGGGNQAYMGANINLTSQNFRKGNMMSQVFDTMSREGTNPEGTRKLKAIMERAQRLINSGDGKDMELGQNMIMGLFGANEGKSLGSWNENVRQGIKDAGFESLDQGTKEAFTRFVQMGGSDATGLLTSMSDSSRADALGLVDISEQTGSTAKERRGIMDAISKRYTGKAFAPLRYKRAMDAYAKAGASDTEDMESYSKTIDEALGQLTPEENRALGKKLGLEDLALGKIHETSVLRDESIKIGDKYREDYNDATPGVEATTRKNLESVTAGSGGFMDATSQITDLIGGLGRSLDEIFKKISNFETTGLKVHLSGDKFGKKGMDFVIGGGVTT